MANIGIVSGLLEEADSFRPGRGEVQSDKPFYVRREDGCIIACAGMGKVNAAVASTFLLSEGCEILLSVGVAGRLGNEQHRTYWIDEAVQHDYGSWRDDGFTAYRAGSMPFGEEKLQLFTAVENPGIDLPAARIATGDSFIEDERCASDIRGKHGAELVDMETAAIAQVAALYGKPWAAIRTVSDSASTGSADEFRQNLVDAAAAAAQHADRVVKLLERH